MRALFLCLLVLPATADASVSDEYRETVISLMTEDGFRCGRVSRVIQSTDPGWECSVSGPAAATGSPFACLDTLDASCVDIGGDDDDGDGFTIDGGDCDDDSSAVNPDAFEVCDGVDNDCSGEVDGADAIDAVLWYLDLDRDGYGDPDVTRVACAQPFRHVSDNTDCFDNSADTNPGADELCEGLFDNDCDGVVDEDGAVDAPTWYGDDDADGYGETADAVTSCQQPAGYEALDGDCDDTNDWTYPGATELCDGQRNDCSASWTSDAGTASLLQDGTGTWYDYTALMASGTYASPVSFNITRQGTLNICAGTWYTEMQIQTDLEVVGLDGRAAVILSGGNSAVPLEALSSVDVTVRDLSVQDGYSPDFGGGLRFNGVNDIVLDNLSITSCSSDEHAGGVLIYNADSATLTDVAITGNDSAQSAGGLSLYGIDGVTLDNVEVSDNTAVTYAGGLYMFDLTDVSITGSLFNDNYSDTGAGMVISDSSGVTISSSQISDNYAIYYGGAAWVSNSEATFSDVSMEQNDSEYAGGIFVEGAAADLTLNTCDLIDNDASGTGGALYMYDGILDVNSSDFAANNPNDVYASGSYSYGYGASFSCTTVGCY